MLEPRVGSPMHALWPLWERRIKRSIAAKSEAQLASLEMPPTLRTLGLARIGRIADTDPTTIAREPVKQLRDTALAEGGNGATAADPSRNGNGSTKRGSVAKLCAAFPARASIDRHGFL
jgi:hypothetical protein